MTDPQFIAFLVAITLLTISPGVDTLLVLRNTNRGGWKDGVVSSFGICSGLFVHATVSAVGISVILLQSSWAFGVLKLAGAIYLIWLGIQSLTSLRKPIIGDVVSVAGHNFNWSRSIREGLLSNVLNPKTVIFYMAFLPQFINPEFDLLAQSLGLAGIHFVISMMWLCALTLMLCKLKGCGIGRRVEKTLQGATGAVMITLGLSLAFEQRGE
ncbi:LysE family translocator [Neptunomonas japonica]|uniref:Threonine transporter RhtB n=1 Tax=Neptunomonas japonica JAMM 1380 TaxID=1441457 RepID=A0A7R6PJC3_9GAMM|nr:LysE family translocator [Neptunomonas japonica]BBB30171.1 threonine transporter RhtB [Neptunomonas japonica JAMM 1380]